MNVRLRPATAVDLPLIERIYFETQRWLIEALFGWRGDDVERGKFSHAYPNEDGIDIIVSNGQDVGWQLIRRKPDHIDLDGIYIEDASQRGGIGTFLIRELIDEASSAGLPLRLSTAKINPARSLYEPARLHGHRRRSIQSLIRIQTVNHVVECCRTLGTPPGEGLNLSPAQADKQAGGRALCRT